MPDEIHQKHIKQDTPGLRKRWFQGDRCDLSIWQDPSGAVMHFQLILDGDLIIDYRSDRGMITGRVDGSRAVGHHPSSPVIVEDPKLNLQTLQFAFREFIEAPPMSQKRVLKFVAMVLHAAISDPDRPRFPDKVLPPGTDSAMIELRSLAESMKKLEEAQQREGMIQRLLSRFMGGK